MANKTMKTLTIGANIYEIVDEAARTDIEVAKIDIETLKQDSETAKTDIEALKQKEIDLDTTLTQSGMAADAKSVGDAISGLTPEAIGALSIDVTDAEQGTANLINADQLGGVLADEYALKQDLSEYALKSEVPDLGGNNSGVAKINFSSVLSASGWSEITPYSQTITVEGITSEDRPYVFIDLSTATEDSVDAIESGWALVKYALTSENTITFYCIKEAPTVDLPIEGEVISAETNYDSAEGVDF